MNFLSNDSFLGRILDKVCTLVLLNLCFMVCCLPVITAGAALTALYYAVLKMHKDKEVSAVRLFFRSFRQNWKQATAGWVLILFLLLAAWMEHLFFPDGSPIAMVFSISILALLFLALLLFLYLFPVIAAFDNNLKTLICHSFYFAFRKIGYFVAILCISCIPMYFTLVDAQMFPIYLLIWLLCGFSLSAWANAWFFYRLFRPYLGISTDDSSKSDATPDSYVF